MSLGIRDTAEVAVRAGIEKILFTVQPESTAVAMDEWLKSLKPVPSPWLVKGKLSSAAKRGEDLFNSQKTGCATCHVRGLYTDLKHHNVGTSGVYDTPELAFDTPTLVELWRTAPYLHDGSAATVREVITAHNPNNKHGKTSQLTPAQLDDLTAFLLSL
jgi:cytochrome c peroxidase